MKLRFEVNQAEAFRRGIDVPKSIVTVEANPVALSERDRHLIADRLIGIDVHQVFMHEGRVVRSGCRITANEPTFDALMEAIRQNDGELSMSSK